MKLLVIDDSESDRFIYRRLVRKYTQAHIELIEVEHTERALELAQSQSFDLAISDYRMPGCHGHELVARLRASPKWNDAPIVIATGCVTEQVRREALAAGACEVILKDDLTGSTFAELLDRCLDHDRGARETG